MIPVYETIMHYDKILVVHIGTGPTSTNFFPKSKLTCPYVGVKQLKKILKNYPEMKIVVPHLGAEEYHEMWDLTEEYTHLYFDTAMIGTKNNPAFDDGISSIDNESLYKIEDRILFGSDYPNLPYPYENSYLGWLEREMDNSFYEKLFYRNVINLLS